jgi:hypothetical protein
MNRNVKQILVYKVFNDDVSTVPVMQQRYENTAELQTTLGSEYVLCEIYDLAFPVNGMIILKLMYEKRMGWYGLDSSGSGYGPLEGSCEHGNKPSGSVKDWEIS